MASLKVKDYLKIKYLHFKDIFRKDRFKEKEFLNTNQVKDWMDSLKIMILLKER